jgi:hypothetical protein
MTDRIEIYRTSSQVPFASVASSFQPQKGDLVYVLGATWKVVGLSFAIDDLGDRARMRCNLIVRKAR